MNEKKILFIKPAKQYIRQKSITLLSESSTLKDIKVAENSIKNN